MVVFLAPTLGSKKLMVLGIFTNTCPQSFLITNKPFEHVSMEGNFSGKISALFAQFAPACMGDGDHFEGKHAWPHQTILKFLLACTWGSQGRDHLHTRQPAPGAPGLATWCKGHKFRGAQGWQPCKRPFFPWLQLHLIGPCPVTGLPCKTLHTDMLFVFVNY